MISHAVHPPVGHYAMNADYPRSHEIGNHMLNPASAAWVPPTVLNNGHPYQVRFLIQRLLSGIHFQH